MMSPEQNELITRTGPGTKLGVLMRHYWHPVALVEELAEQRPAKAVRVLGRDFVLFRDERGRYGLLDRACPHRGADLAYGRLENGGLRCLFHGWLFDVDGKCLETPAEPEGSVLCQRVRQRSWPVVVKNGIVFAYLGEGQPPAFPDFDCFLAPSTHAFAFKGLIECNWLQALEVGIDPAHASYLHRFFEDEDPEEGYGKQFRAASLDSDIPMSRLMRELPRPTIDVEPTEFGMRLFTHRQVNDKYTHLRVTNLVFPYAFVIPMSGEMTITQWHVPIDDESCYWYAIFTSFGAPVDHRQMREQRLQLYQLPDYRPRLGRHNQYGYDVGEQASQTYTGMGFDINVHDQWAIESQGRIQDRTREHLGYSDKAIVAYRRLLLSAIGQVANGEKPLMWLDASRAAEVRGPITVDGLCPADGWQAYWKDVDRRRRGGSSWAAATLPPLVA
jgi:phenylpropionate dioxygenase-like ring-hydroxylating dioxygenase large terminal subunit